MASPSFNPSAVDFVHMAPTCPRCGKSVPDDAIYCPYCAHGLKPSALTGKVSAAGVLMLAGTVGFFVVFVISLNALIQVYSWYPPLIAQKWFFYDQILTAFCFCGFLLGAATTTLVFARRKHRLAVILGILCAISGAGTWVTSIIIPEFNVLYSILYYFLPDLVAPLSGILLIYQRKPEFK
jgi:hypothetical protein